MRFDFSFFGATLTTFKKLKVDQKEMNRCAPIHIVKQFKKTL